MAEALQTSTADQQIRLVEYNPENIWLGSKRSHNYAVIEITLLADL